MENNINVVPVVSYYNAYVLKSEVYKNNKGKSGIYRWNNVITGKSYVGSSINLSNRFSKYYSITFLKNQIGSSIIYSAVLKYNISNFSLDILEYCEDNILSSREQYYIDILKPEYNILKVAGSRLYITQSEETRQLISDKLKNRLKTLLPIKVTNIETNIIKYYANNREAAKYLNISERTLGRYKSKKKILFNKYLITNELYLTSIYIK